MSIRQATSFWIEAGAMSGGAAHQIEFPNELAEFFDDNARHEEVVTIRFPDGQSFIRPLTYRGTDYGQWTDIWRLGMPTANMGGPQYSGRVIKFERLQEGENTVYVLSVADAGSSESQAWNAQSSTKDQTGGPQGRRYGYW